MKRKLKCFTCNKTLPLNSFSSNQIRKNENRRCGSCLKAPQTQLQNKPPGHIPLLTRVAFYFLPRWFCFLVVLIVAIALGVTWYLSSFACPPRLYSQVVSLVRSQTHVDKGIVFLCAKGIFASDPFRQNLELMRLRVPSNAPKLLQDHYRKAQARLVRLISQPEENHTDTLPSGVHSFSPNEFHGYNTSNVYFLKYPKKLVQRHQLSGLCYMHAPAVVQYYKLDTTKNNTPMIDLLQIVRDHFTSEQLAQHIFNDQGGSSKEFLEFILEPNSTLVPSGIISNILYFDQYGVGLVSGFKVHDDFSNAIVHHHYGKPSGNFLGLHAMALVGHRKDQNGKQFYLLQNWWKDKQFVEVDDDYLKYSGASIYFIETPQTRIPGNFSKNFGKFFELELVDKPERHPYEM